MGCAVARKAIQVKQRPREILLPTHGKQMCKAFNPLMLWNELSLITIYVSDCIVTSLILMPVQGQRISTDRMCWSHGKQQVPEEM